MDNRARFSSLSSSYDDFLFAAVCDEASGMRLSVLSALARINLDPWEEAKRLAAMPSAIAERTLVSILDIASGRHWSAPEAEATAARLVRLLPDPAQAAAVASPGSATAPAILKGYWWLWVGLALGMSFLMPNHEAAKTSPGMASTEAIVPATMPAAAPAVSAQTAAPAVPTKASTPAPSKSKNAIPDPVELSR